MTATHLKITALVVLVLGISALALPGVAAAAENNTTTTAPAEPSQDIIYQFDGSTVELVDVDFRDGTAYATFRSDRPETVSIGEGAIDGTGSFNFATVRIYPGEETVVELPVREEAIVITTGQDGYYYEGDVGAITVLFNRPTTQIVQLAGFAGVLGSMLAVGIVVGNLRRNHANNYREVFSGQKHGIEKDPVEGIREKAIRKGTKAIDSPLKIVLWVAALMYGLAILVGNAPGPGAIWGSLEDVHRLLVAGSIAATSLALAPAHALIKRIWNPHREYIVDLDATDLYQAAQKSGSGQISAYSGPPERIADLDVDGGLVTVTTPGGRAHLVREFDPSTNEAEATLPGLHDDRELALKEGTIEGNRRILRDEAEIGRDLLKLITAIEIAADQNAVAGINQVLREHMVVEGSTLEDFLEDAAEGTRYEGQFSESTEGPEEGPGVDFSTEDLGPWGDHS